MAFFGKKSGDGSGLIIYDSKGRAYTEDQIAAIMTVIESGEWPNLPEPELDHQISEDGDEAFFEYYTAEQMREYGALCAAAAKP